jgi:CheY-like chemotaxis protein
MLQGKVMEPEVETNGPAGHGAEPISKATSELNNLLQIIAGTSSVIENIWEGTDGSEKYLAMLRVSIERAEKVTAELAHHAGGCEKKTLFNPGMAGFSKTKNAPDSGTPRQNILVVDDEKMALTLVKRILSDAGFHVVTAQSGFDCLDIFRRRPHSFDLVLLDLTMPFMNGEETFTRLHEIRPDVPVVLCTGFIDQERLNRMLREGLSGFLRKPIAPNEIVGHVRSILEGARFMGTGVPSGISAAV